MYNGLATTVSTVKSFSEERKSSFLFYILGFSVDLNNIVTKIAAFVRLNFVPTQRDYNPSSKMLAVHEGKLSL